MKQKTKPESISVAEYKELVNPTQTGKKRQSRKRIEGLFQDQCKNRFESYQCWNQLTKKAIFVHVPNERVFSTSIISLLRSKGVPLSANQAKVMSFYLNGFAKNLAKAGAKKSFPDNIIVGDGKTVIFFELKVNDNKATADQEVMLNLLKSFGFPVYLLYNIDEFDEMLKKEGLIKELY